MKRMAPAMWLGGSLCAASFVVALHYAGTDASRSLPAARMPVHEPVREAAAAGTSPGSFASTAPTGPLTEMPPSRREPSTAASRPLLAEPRAASDATLSHAQVTLLGTTTWGADREALVRLDGADARLVRVGDAIDGMTVTAIGDRRLTLTADHEATTVELREGASLARPPMENAIPALEATNAPSADAGARPSVTAAREEAETADVSARLSRGETVTNPP